MTQKELETAFSAFMPGSYGSRLAALLCQPETVPQTVDGMDKTLFPEDGKRFDEDEGFRPRTARSVAEQHVYDYYYGSDLLLRMPSCAFIHRWMRNMLETQLPDKGRALRSLGEDGDPYKEIALAICALSKAFPGNTRALAEQHIMKNWLYRPFWDGAMQYCAPLLDDEA